MTGIVLLVMWGVLHVIGVVLNHINTNEAAAAGEIDDFGSKIEGETLGWSLFFLLFPVCWLVMWPHAFADPFDIRDRHRKHDIAVLRDNHKKELFEIGEWKTYRKWLGECEVLGDDWTHPVMMNEPPFPDPRGDIPNPQPGLGRTTDLLLSARPSWEAEADEYDRHEREYTLLGMQDTDDLINRIARELDPEPTDAASVVPLIVTEEPHGPNCSGQRWDCSYVKCKGRWKYLTEQFSKSVGAEPPTERDIWDAERFAELIEQYHEVPVDNMWNTFPARKCMSCRWVSETFRGRDGTSLEFWKCLVCGAAKHKTGSGAHSVSHSVRLKCSDVGCKTVDDVHKHDWYQCESRGMLAKPFRYIRCKCGARCAEGDYETTSVAALNGDTVLRTFHVDKDKISYISRGTGDTGPL